MRLAACLIFIALSMASMPGCGATRIHAVRDGATTWRGEELPLERDGGIINAHVMSEFDGDVTVVLIDAHEYETHSGEDVQPFSAALGHPREGRVTVSFSGLPAGRYLVFAFVDIDGDGQIQERGGLFNSSDARFEEPAAGYEHVVLELGKTVDVDLNVR
jgi:hypothetical protein